MTLTTVRFHSVGAGAFKLRISLYSMRIISLIAKPPEDTISTTMPLQSAALPFFICFNAVCSSCIKNGEMLVAAVEVLSFSGLQSLLLELACH